MIDVFGADEICSFAIVPFLQKGLITSYFITYIKMKDNWHASVNRYLLNEEDLNLYRLLFRELGHALNRLDYYEKVSEMNRRLKETATTDTLTGIKNRAGMYELIQKMLSDMETKEISHGVGVMFIDLDNFKPYNDTYGHDIGDLVLRELATIFKTAVGDAGFVSRHGGDEFIIILYTDDKSEIERIAKRIYRLIEAANGFSDIIERALRRTIVLDDKHRISCSIGIAVDADVQDEKKIELLIQKADNSMYLVKAEGKGNYKFV
jgi:diguanylate cyclase (GGDEF)-like protein